MVARFSTHQPGEGFGQSLAKGAALTAELVRRPVPEFYPMPQKGRCPWFGLSRTRLYELEKTGAIRLYRDRKPGTKQGAVYVPYDQVAAFMRSLPSGIPCPGAPNDAQHAQKPVA